MKLTAVECNDLINLLDSARQLIISKMDPAEDGCHDEDIVNRLTDKIDLLKPLQAQFVKEMERQGKIEGAIINAFGDGQQARWEDIVLKVKDELGPNFIKDWREVRSVIYEMSQAKKLYRKDDVFSETYVKTF